MGERVKRFSCRIGTPSGSSYSGAIVNPDGDYVLYADYASLHGEALEWKDRLRQMTECRDDLNRLVAQRERELAEANQRARVAEKALKKQAIGELLSDASLRLKLYDFWLQEAEAEGAVRGESRCSHCGRVLDGTIQRCSNDGFCKPICEGESDSGH